jgi:hypothetical protein
MYRQRLYDTFSLDARLCQVLDTAVNTLRILDNLNRIAAASLSELRPQRRPSSLEGSPCGRLVRLRRHASWLTSFSCSFYPAPDGSCGAATCQTPPCRTARAIEEPARVVFPCSPATSPVVRSRSIKSTGRHARPWFETRGCCPRSSPGGLEQLKSLRRGARRLSPSPRSSAGSASCRWVI